MQVSISSGVWAESLHALQNAPPIRGGMLNDLSDGRIKKTKHFLKIRFDLSMVYLKEFVYACTQTAFVYLSCSKFLEYNTLIYGYRLQIMYIWLFFIYARYSLNKLTSYVHIVFWYQSRIYIYSMLVSLKYYNFIFGPNEYIILISIFSKCIQYKTDQKQSS